MDHEKDGGVPLLGHFGRSLSNLFTRCATPGQVIVLSIDDITNGLGDEVEYLLDGNKRGDCVPPCLTSQTPRCVAAITLRSYIPLQRLEVDEHVT
ncbi:hypothetical protein OUZ56_001632 [Daphnia magna]|uniref:Uncharacterized protein n=1 Tax=Daphnia magna TaxID=35525 RepID=A0ABR0A390_9CRUS|nr:hypothetical protein OUZ56_001632 [Daphnia magna]